MKGKKAIQSKFPTARIKKIMQEDEEIGKVAAGAPIVISRALELFLKDIVLASSRIAQQQNTKKIMPYHIKRLAAQDRTYDFLDDVLAKFVDPTGGAVSGGGGVAGSGAGVAGGKGKAKSQARESSDEEEDSDQDQDQDEGNGNGNPDRGGSEGSFEE